MLQITPQALQEFQRILAQKGRRAVRIFAMGSGCCGPSVGMDLVEQGEPGDVLLGQDGPRIYVERAASEVLAGVTIDFGGVRKGFVLKHPEGGCGCG